MIRLDSQDDPETIRNLEVMLPDGRVALFFRDCNWMSPGELSASRVHWEQLAHQIEEIGLLLGYTGSKPPAEMMV